MRAKGSVCSDERAKVSRAGMGGLLLAVIAAFLLLGAGSASAASNRALTLGETTGGVTNTWSNYTNAGGTFGGTIGGHVTVQITCRLTGFRVADGNTWWYQIASSPWNNNFYASADAFYNNGQTSGSLNGTPFVDTAVPICGSSPPPSDGGGGTPGGGTTGGGTTTTSPQWQVTGPAVSWTTYLGQQYTVGFTVKNVGTASGPFAITDDDPGCSHSASQTIQVGQTVTLKFTCVHRWSWIAPFGSSKWSLLNELGTQGSSFAAFFAHVNNISSQVRNALHSQKIPSVFMGRLDALDLVGTVDSVFSTSFEATRQVLLMNQGKNWRPTFVNHFTFTPAISGLTTEKDVFVYVPQYKWDAFGSYAHNEIAAISFNFAGIIVSLVQSKVKWVNPAAAIGLFVAGKVIDALAKYYSWAAERAYNAAYDPSPDYATAPTVAFTPTPELDALPDGAAKEWAIAQSHALDVEAARDEAAIRYAGAVEADDADAQALQLAAIQQFDAEEQELVTAHADGLQQVLSVLPAGLDADQQQELATTLAAPNFAATEAGQALVAAGQTPEDVNDLAQQLSATLVPGEPVDLQQAVGNAADAHAAMAQESAGTTGLQLAGVQLNLGQPVALVSLDKTPGDDGSFEGPVVATISASTDAAPADHLEYSLDGASFARYSAPLTIATPGDHTVAARAVGTDGTVQDPAVQQTIDIAAPHSPPAAAIANPFVVADTSHGLPATVTLDGTPSHDDNSDPLTYSWTFDDPDGTTQNATSSTVTHTFTHYGVYTAHLTVNNGFFTSTAQASVNVADTTPPTVTAPADASFAAGSQTQQRVDAWLASVTAHDDDGAGHFTVSNDFTALPPVGTPLVVTWTATDAAGNVGHASATLTITDGTPPVIEPELTGTLGTSGWYTGDVHVLWHVADPESAVSAQLGCGDTSITTDTDADGVAVTCTATSDGGTSEQTVRIKRDATPPTVEATRSPAPNAAGWSNTDVTVTFACADGGSGVADCSGPAVLREGTDQSATGVAVDRAGNTARATLEHVDVDETAPTLSGVPTTQPSPSGWYSGDVTIHWACADAGGSGIDGACPADGTVTGEGAGLTTGAHVVDRAGNETSGTSDSVKIDRTAPRTSISAPTGWTRDDVAVTLTADDGLSGVAGTHVSVDGADAILGNAVTITGEGRHTVTYWSTDNAGNVEERQTAVVLIDKTAPTISSTQSPGANGAGWNNSDVTIAFACADPLSGVAFCTPTQVVGTEGRGISIDGRAADNAGNTAGATATVSIDKTPPTITATADRAPNAAGWYKADVAVSFACADALSGVASCADALKLGEGANQTARGTATDAAGNEGAAALGPLNVDETPPVVTYTGNAAIYTVDQTVAISCGATDALSGVAETTCADVSGAAWTFGLGTTSRSASAADRAGNSATGSVSFVVRVTCASLEALVSRFSTDPDVTAGLNAKVEAVCAAPNANAKSGKLGAFDNQVAAQSGKALTKAQADLLQQLAGAV